MKKILTVLFSFLLAISFLPSCSKAQNSVLKIGLEKLVAYCYKGESGDADGFYVQAMKKIAKSAGFSDVEFVVCNHSELYEKLESGEIDCIVSKNCSDYGNFQKSESFYYSGGAVLIPEDNEFASAQTFEAAKDAKMCFLAFSAEKKAFAFENTVYFDTMKEVDDAIESGECDGFAGDYLVARAYRIIASVSMSMRIFPDVEIEGEDNCHYLYFANKKAEYIEKLNSAIKKFSLDDAQKIAEGIMESLDSKY